MPDACSFCELDQLEPLLVAEAEDFVLMSHPQPLTAGHLLLLPRVHLGCLGELPESLDGQYFRLKERAVGFVNACYGQAVCYERQSLGGQHARLHVLVGELTDHPEAAQSVVPARQLQTIRTRNDRGAAYEYLESSSHGWLSRPDGESDERQGLPGCVRVSPAEEVEPRAVAGRVRFDWQRHCTSLGFPTEVVICFLRQGGRVTLLKRSELVDSAPGKWHGVSGYLPDGVAPLNHALVEIEQELGLYGSQLKLATAESALTFSDPLGERRWRIYPFLFDLLEGDLRLNWEHSAIEWVRPNDVASYDTLPWLPKLVRSLTAA